MFQLRSVNYRKILVRGILALLVGLVLLFVPGLTITTIVKLLGTLIIINGAYSFIASNIKSRKSTTPFFFLSGGIFSIVIGILFVAYPEGIVKMFIALIGIFLLLAGLSQFGSQFGGRSILGLSWIYLLFAGVAVVSGIVMLVNPFESAEAIMKFIGVIIAIYGCSEIFWAEKIRRFKKTNPEDNTIDADYEEVK